VNAKVIRTQLENAGYSIDCVSDGFKAIESCKKQRYDLILMDIQMPKLDGLAATQQIHQVYDNSPPPIIGISAHVLDDDKNTALDAGMNDYLCKPVKKIYYLKK